MYKKKVIFFEGQRQAVVGVDFDGNKTKYVFKVL